MHPNHRDSTDQMGCRQCEASDQTNTWLEERLLMERYGIEAALLEGYIRKIIMRVELEQRSCVAVCEAEGHPHA
jgi:hypothetical protein